MVVKGLGTRVVTLERIHSTDVQTDAKWLVMRDKNLISQITDHRRDVQSCANSVAAVLTMPIFDRRQVQQTTDGASTAEGAA
jgi:hypothetical protein